MKHKTNCLPKLAQLFYVTDFIIHLYWKYAVLLAVLLFFATVLKLICKKPRYVFFPQILSELIFSMCIFWIYPLRSVPSVCPRSMRTTDIGVTTIILNTHTWAAEKGWSATFRGCQRWQSLTIKKQLLTKPYVMPQTCNFIRINNYNMIMWIRLIWLMMVSCCSLSRLRSWSSCWVETTNLYG